MQKIHVIRQFFEASGPQGHFFEKTKKPFLDKVNGSMCAKFQVCIVVSAARRRDINKQINTLIHKHTHFQVNLRISSTGCLPHVDFKNKDTLLTNRIKIRWGYRRICVGCFYLVPGGGTC